METIQKYFKGLDCTQLLQLQQLVKLYTYWNKQINVISRKDVPNLYGHHVLPSLSIARLVSFKPGTKILDAGTGGGFPGIPLAILFPESVFYLVDSRGKKIMVVSEIVASLGLKNVFPLQSRVEDLTMKVDFVVSRALAPVPELFGWVKKLIRPGGFNDLPNGIIYLTGGEIITELPEAREPLKVVELLDYFNEPYLATKKLVYIRF